MNSSPLNVVARAERKTEMKTSIAKCDQLNNEKDHTWSMNGSTVKNLQILS